MKVYAVIASDKYEGGGSIISLHRNESKAVNKADLLNAIEEEREACYQEWERNPEGVEHNFELPLDCIYEVKEFMLED